MAVHEAEEQGLISSIAFLSRMRVTASTWNVRPAVFSDHLKKNNFKDNTEAGILLGCRRM